MARAQKAFFEQIELEEEDVIRDFLTRYAYGLLDEEKKEPVLRAVDMLNDEWELNPPATPTVLQPWIEDEEAVYLAKLRVEAEIRKENAIQKFREQREAGATYKLTPY